METHSIILLYPALLIGVMLTAILVGVRYPQARWWDTLLRCGVVVVCFFPLQIALALGAKGGPPPDHQMDELCIITGILGLAFCLPELIIAIVMACRLLIYAIARLMGKHISRPKGKIALGISPLWMLTPPGVLILSAKAQAGRHTEMLLRGLSFGLWSMLGLWALSYSYPLGTKEDYHAWAFAEFQLRTACFVGFLLLPEIVRSVADRHR